MGQLLGITQRTICVIHQLSHGRFSPRKLIPVNPKTLGDHLLLKRIETDLTQPEVAGSTNGQIKMGPGTLYGTVKRLLEVQLIEESDERPDPQLDDERRRYYRLTGVGEQVVKAEARRYAEIVEIARGKKLIRKPA